MSSQLPVQRSAIRVTARPDEQFEPNRPIFSALLLYIAMRSRMAEDVSGEDATATSFMRGPNPSGAAPPQGHGRGGQRQILARRADADKDGLLALPATEIEVEGDVLLRPEPERKRPCHVRPLAGRRHGRDRGAVDKNDDVSRIADPFGVDKPARCADLPVIDPHHPVDEPLETAGRVAGRRRGPRRRVPHSS